MASILVAGCQNKNFVEFELAHYPRNSFRKIKTAASLVITFRLQLPACLVRHVCTLAKEE
jgi:hypothetical protein